MKNRLDGLMTMILMEGWCEINNDQKNMKAMMLDKSPSNDSTILDSKTIWIVAVNERVAAALHVVGSFPDINKKNIENICSRTEHMFVWPTDTCSGSGCLCMWVYMFVNAHTVQEIILVWGNIFFLKKAKTYLHVITLTDHFYTSTIVCIHRVLFNITAA